MKKGLFVILVLVLSYAILAVGNGMMGGPEAGAGGEAVLTGIAQGFGGEVSVTVTMAGDKIANVVAVGEDETQGIGSNAIDQLPGKIVEANSTDVDAVAGASVTSKAIIEAVNNALKSKASGEGTTLTGTAKGFGGDVIVTVTMDGDKIVKVEAQGPDETEGVGSTAIDQLPEKIVEVNSTDVDAVAGASITSNAIIDAVNNALELAK